MPPHLGKIAMDGLKFERWTQSGLASQRFAILFCPVCCTRCSWQMISVGFGAVHLHSAFSAQRATNQMTPRQIKWNTGPMQTRRHCSVNPLSVWVKRLLPRLLTQSSHLTLPIVPAFANCEVVPQTTPGSQKWPHPMAQESC